MIGVDGNVGLTHDQVVVQRSKFGDNTFPESPMASYFELLLGTLSDTTLLILIAAAAVSLVIGVLSHPEDGWIEGTAIFIAVFLVSNISAGNDYTKQLQFLALEASSAKDERTSVLRAGSIERVNPRDLVVGDVLVLQVRSAQKRLWKLCHHFLISLVFYLFNRLVTPFLRTPSSSPRTSSLPTNLPSPESPTILKRPLGKIVSFCPRAWSLRARSAAPW